MTTTSDEGGGARAATAASDGDGPRGDRFADRSDPLAGGAGRRLLAGARAAFAGLPFALRHERVVAWTAVTMAAAVVVWLVALWQAAAWQETALAAILPAKPAATWRVVVWDIGYALAFVAYWLTALVVGVIAAQPVVAPLLGVLAERVEEADFGDPPRSVGVARRLREAAHGVGRAALLAMMQLGGGLAIWAISGMLSLVFPPLGTVVGVLVGGGWAALWLAGTALGYGLENHHVGIGRQLGLMTRALPLLLGFGAVAQLVAWLPLAMPLLVVSATLLAGRLHRHGHLTLDLRAHGKGAG